VGFFRIGFCLLLLSGCQRFEDAYFDALDSGRQPGQGGAGGATRTGGAPGGSGGAAVGGAGGQLAAGGSTGSCGLGGRGGTGVNLNTDVNNCGACGRRCDTVCDAGLCSPQAFGATMPSGSRFHGFTVSAGVLFVTESNFDSQNNRLWALSLDGGAASVAGQEPLSDVAVFENRVFVSRWGLSPGFSVGPSTGAPQLTPLNVAMDGVGSIFSLLAVDGGVLAVEYGPVFSRLWFIANGGQAVSAISLPANNATGLATCGETAFVTIQQSGDAGSVVEVVAPTRPNPTVGLFATGLDDPWGVTCDNDFVFVTTYGSQQLLRWNRDGGSRTVLATGLTGPRGLLVDGEYLYVAEFTELLEDGGIAQVDGGPIVNRLLRLNRDGGSLLELARHTGGIFVRRFGDFIYWSSLGDARVRRIPRYPSP
jgi:hypothetical protein